MATALVTGGAGFIGSHVCEILLSQGYEVHVLDNLSSGRKENLTSQVLLHEFDIRSKEVEKVVRKIKPNLVVHLAAQISVRTSMEDPVLDVDINVRGLVNLLHCFDTEALPFFVFISTGGAIYGRQDYFPADEDHPIRPESVYGLSKRTAEQYLELWKRAYGLRFAVLRLANVYGPRQNSHGEAGVVAIFSERLLKGEVPIINGDGEQTRDFVYVKDVAEAVGKVVEQGAEGIFNIGTGQESSVNTVYRLIAAGVGSTIVPKHGPVKAGEQRRSSISSKFAGSVFGWKANTELEQGIKETVEWFKISGA
ncbi:MAG: NAD-dependent epimerase/dehydratase family protein [SAR324 cluster bacterium]|uniref:NAD-dependent epimerase/dehydratase family protein n=1 Tax=SAR324 cluster bacterium TaxID=2024889 RepID=A0A7X9FUN7_9DELT|nr:NAD-dependent epimerase/dehydratase family protein [SAR324 cluster bacterium]